MLENTVAVLKSHLKNPVIGDLMAKELIEYYIEKRNVILGYRGKSAVDKSKFEYYERKLIEDNYDFWFSHYSKAYINRVLWILRRLKVGITPKQEYELINEYYDRMPMSELMFSRYDRNTLAADQNLKAYFQKHGVIK